MMEPRQEGSVQLETCLILILHKIPIFTLARGDLDSAVFREF